MTHFQDSSSGSFRYRIIYGIPKTGRSRLCGYAALRFTSPADQRMNMLRLQKETLNRLLGEWALILIIVSILDTIIIGIIMVIIKMLRRFRPRS